MKTSTGSDYMKKWKENPKEDELPSEVDVIQEDELLSEADVVQEGENVGLQH